MDDFSRYEALRDAGATAREVYLEAKNAKIDQITAIRMLRQLFGLSLVEAKQAMSGAPLQERQQQLKEPLEQSLREPDDEK